MNRSSNEIEIHGQDWHWILLYIGLVVFAAVGMTVTTLKIYGKVMAAITNECTNGSIIEYYTDHSNLKCVDGRWAVYVKSEIQIAQEAKKKKADYEARLLERYKFCGEGNVDTQLGSGYDKQLPCKDYSLVPDENLNI